MKDIHKGDNDLSKVPENSNMLILCEGLMNMNNSTLSLYNSTDKTIINKYFQKVNKRGLGDTANDMKRYGNKTYILVNISSQLEIIDHKSGKSLKQIALFDDMGNERQPRKIAFHQDKAYISCFDGVVLRVDTATMEIDGMVQCGRNPEGLCIANNKIYVANSGGLDNPNYDNRISVVSIEPFEHKSYITVEDNPVNIASDSHGDIYVISNGNYGSVNYCLQRINSKTDTRVQIFEDINPLNITIHNDTAYMYSYDFNTDTQWLKTFDCKTEQILSNNFITDGTEIEKPYGININPSNGDIIICEAYQYVTWGDILCFDRNGKLKYRINEIGLNPNAIVFF